MPLHMAKARVEMVVKIHSFLTPAPDTVVSFTPRPLQPCGKVPVTHRTETGDAQQPVGTLSKTDTFLDPVRNRTAVPRTV
jgi:hypothetical protein